MSFENIKKLPTCPTWVVCVLFPLRVLRGILAGPRIALLWTWNMLEQLSQYGCYSTEC